MTRSMMIPRIRYFASHIRVFPKHLTNIKYKKIIHIFISKVILASKKHNIITIQPTNREMTATSRHTTNTINSTPTITLQIQSIQLKSISLPNRRLTSNNYHQSTNQKSPMPLPSSRWLPFSHHLHTLSIRQFRCQISSRIIQQPRIVMKCIHRHRHSSK